MGGTSPAPLLTQGLAGTLSPVQFYTRRGSMRCPSPGSPRSTSSDHVPGHAVPFLDYFLAHFGRVLRVFPRRAVLAAVGHDLGADP
jgi:hypothetical protein